MDNVQLVGIASTMPATAVVDGRGFTGCFEDRKGYGAWSWFWNIRSKQACHSEIVAFAEGAAMTIEPQLNAFTDPAGDVVPVTMPAVVNVPVKIFVMSGDINGNIAARMTAANNDVARANQIYGNGQCGIQFSIAVNKNSTRGSFVPALLLSTCTGNIEAFNGVDPQTADPGISVFYVEGPTGLQGKACLANNSALITLTWSSTNETLAHELGHALMLDHPLASHSMTADNLMHSPAVVPGALTLGQCYRANVDGQSVVNTSKFRNGPIRPCPHIGGTGSECFALNFSK